MKKIKNLIKKVPPEIYVFIFALLYRLPSLGNDFINSDAFHWKERGYAFGSALTSLNFADTAVTYHPGVPLLWSQFISNKMYSFLCAVGVYSNLNPHDEFLINHFLQKLVLVIITSFLIALVYNLLKNIDRKLSAIIAIVLVLLEPFYLGLSRAIHTDVLLSLFMFISFLFFFKFVYQVIDGWNQKENTSCHKYRRNILFAGIFLGLAALTKSSGLFLLPFFILIVLVVFAKYRDKNLIRGVLMVILFGIVTFVLLWPAMWVTPVKSLETYIFQGIKGVGLEEGHGHIWFGKETLDPGVAFYPIVLVARYSPLLLAFFTGGIVYYLLKRKKLDRKTLYFIGFNLVYIISYFVMITMVSKKLDRYSLPIILPLSVIASYYIPRIASRRLIISVLLITIVFRGVLFYGLHPDYLAYYSPLIGGVEHGRYIVEPKWPVGYKNISDYFNNLQSKNSKVIKVAIADHDYLRPFSDFEVLNIQHEVERDNANYFVLPVYRPQRNSFYKERYNLKELHDVIKIAGVDYYYIYKVEGKK